eukprot:4238734-Pleurochrysis_carterae.AAC.8
MGQAAVGGSDGGRMWNSREIAQDSTRTHVQLFPGTAMQQRQCIFKRVSPLEKERSGVLNEIGIDASQAEAGKLTLRTKTSDPIYCVRTLRGTSDAHLTSHFAPVPASHLNYTLLALQMHRVQAL